MKATALVSILFLVVTARKQTTIAQLVDPAPPLGGWNILQPAYENNRHLDGFSLEWDYFMIHAANFTGIVGYVLSDPRGRLGNPEPEEVLQLKLTPAGGNLAVAGQFSDGIRISNYRHFGIQATTASATERSFEAVEADLDEFATMAPTLEGRGGLHLQGKTADIAYELTVTQDWAERPPFEHVTSTDIGKIPGEFWTVNMLWARTRVFGSVTRSSDNTTFDIDGHGYREDSWGRWAFPFGGWDFAIVSDESTGVQFAWQSYHYKSEVLDFVDVSFVEDGEVKSVRFEHTAGEVGWQHKKWHWDGTARQCVPDDALVVTDNGVYRVEANVDIQSNQIPLLSDATIATDLFVILEWFPWINGTVTSVVSGEVVATFAGQGGGEISMLRTFFGTFRCNLCCTIWGRLRFNTRLPRQRPKEL